MPDERRRVPKVSDATLRDSAHMPGVAFTPADGVAISRILRDVGIDAIEVGIVSGSDRGDLALCKAVRDEVGSGRAMTLVLARSRHQVRADLALAAELGFAAVMLSIPTSTDHIRLKLGSQSQRQVLVLAADAIREAKKLGMHATFSAEDGARTDPGLLAEYVGAGAAAGADRFRLAETVSVLTPGDTTRLVQAVVQAGNGLEVEIHSHNMLGLAVANALAAAEAGAAWISCTVGGLGERGGNTPLAEVLTCMWRFWDDRRYNLALLTQLSREVAARSAVSFSASTGATAELSYCYEIAGQRLYPEMFEAIPADVVGNNRQVRVRGRVRPALLRACLPAELLDGADLEAAAAFIMRQLPPGKATLSADDLRHGIQAYVVSEQRG